MRAGRWRNDDGRNRCNNISCHDRCQVLLYAPHPLAVSCVATGDYPVPPACHKMQQLSVSAVLLACRGSNCAVVRPPFGTPVRYICMDQEFQPGAELL